MKNNLPFKEKNDHLVQARVNHEYVKALQSSGVDIPQLIRDAIFEAAQRLKFMESLPSRRAK